MSNASGRLAIAELVIYIILLPIAVYILVRHGKPGYTGWGFFLVFCTLRIVSSGLGINDTSTTGGIINSVGISALLLAISGVIHEASTYTSNHRPKPELIVQLLLHLLTTSGIAISAVGASSLVDAKPDQISTYQGMQEGGSLLLLLAVVLLATLNFTTIRNLHATSVNSRQRSTEKAGSLAIGTLVALHLAAVRVIYSVVYAFTHSKSLSPITGTFAVKLCLITLVQLGASLALVAAGVSTRHIQKRSAMRRNMENTELSEGLMK